jgi:hypothetical protein
MKFLMAIWYLAVSLAAGDCRSVRGDHGAAHSYGNGDTPQQQRAELLLELLVLSRPITPPRFDGSCSGTGGKRLTYWLSCPRSSAARAERLSRCRGQSRCLLSRSSRRGLATNVERSQIWFFDQPNAIAAQRFEIQTMT